jgi:hypothetical protein
MRRIGVLMNATADNPQGQASASVGGPRAPEYKFELVVNLKTAKALGLVSSRPPTR